ncbi:ABC transporter permease [Cellulomonas sp. WB94]|nr:ABC transporter permease [Cellulomonas sp. WB94]
MSERSVQVPSPTTARRAGRAVLPARRGPRGRRRSTADRITIVLMVAIPSIVVVGLIWLPAISSVILSFTKWNGIGNISADDFIGPTNYRNVATNYPPFWPAMTHNLIWLTVMFLVATPFGMFLAVLLDKEIRATRVYQMALYMPVVLSLALIGFIWQLIFSKDNGLLNAVTGSGIDWFGDQRYNLWAALVATSWRQVGYIMLLYLAGLKAVDQSLREAAAIDGCSESKAFFRVIFPVMRPINIIILVVTFIESLRAFDLVWIINKGRNGLELISTLVTQNVVGEASRIGFGSALATVMLLISSVFITIYLRVVMRVDR